MTLCLCGCGKKATCDNNYVNGHWNRGTHHSKESRQNISNSLKGHVSCNKGIPMSEEQKLKISKSGIGKHKGMISPNKGKHMTEEQKRNLSIKMKGRTSSRKGITLSEEQKQKQSMAMKGKHPSLETLEKFRKAQSGTNNGFYGKHHTEETKKKLSESSKTHVASEETRKKISILTSGKNNPSYGKPRYHTNKIYYDSPFQGTICFRSSWEAKYAAYLDSINEPWFYELETFELLGGITYTPDFFLPKQEKFVEIKGFFNDKSKVKFEKFKEEYPFNIDILFKQDLKNLGVDLR